MDKKEYVTSFIDTLRNGDENRLYKYFTSRTVVYFVNEHEEKNLDDFILFLKNTFFNEDITIKRILESDVCLKLDIESNKFSYEALFIEIKDRRIKRIEVF